MQKVLLDCRSLEDARTLKNYIEREMPYEAVLSFDPIETQSILGNQSINLLVFQTGILRDGDLDRVRHVRQSGFGSPILTITDRVGELSVSGLAEKQKAYFLEKPFELRTFRGLTRKLMTAKAVPQQQFRRYQTRAVAHLETFITGESISTEMFNLSMGGAYFEINEKPPLGIGDLIRLKIPHSGEARDHHIHGRVVWMTHKGSNLGGFGLGVKFIKANDMYRHLIEKV
jgi:Tfp pilus assembly protein PilZ